jgi:hypothetical protein
MSSTKEAWFKGRKYSPVEIYLPWKIARNHFIDSKLSSQRENEAAPNVNPQHAFTDSTHQYSTPRSSKLGKYQPGDIFDPKILCNGKIPSPVSLSPSSAAEFKACPQSFLFQYIYGIKLPTNPTLAKGTLCHKVCLMML